MPEHKVATTHELQDGETKLVELGETKILLLKLDGKFHAVGGECPHVGGDLSEGTICDGHIRCPWHHARFNGKTGALEEPLSLDGLPKCKVRIEGSDVIVLLPEEPPLSRTMPMAEFDPDADERVFVIVGGGAAGSAAAESLRQNGFHGRIVIVNAGKNIPYDRTELSKFYLKKKGTESKPPALRSVEFYEEHGIELQTGRRVAEVDPEGHGITLEDGTEMQCDACLLAPGSIPRELPVAGSDKDNVFTLRNVADADAIRAAIENSENAVVIGASFIGMETAAILSSRELDVTVVAPESVPFENTLGPETGKLFQGLHESKGVDFRLGHTVDHFEGQNAVSAAVLDNEEKIPADLVIVGIGVKPATEWLDTIELDEDGGVGVDENMRISGDLYAAGDIARFPNPVTRDPVRIEHWRVALQTGRIAGANMAGEQKVYSDVPFFWTMQYFKSVRYVGHATDWDEIVVDGSMEDHDFIAYYVSENSVKAALAWERDQQMDAFAELMRAGRTPSPEDVRSGGLDLVQMLAQT